MNNTKFFNSLFSSENIVKIILVIIAFLLWSLSAEAIDCLSTASLAVAGLVTTDNGVHLSGSPLTTSDTESVSPSLLRSEIDSRIAKIRPSATPLDQISRVGGSRKAGSMKVEYYSVDIKPGESTVTSVVKQHTYEEDSPLMVPVQNINVFAPTETVLFPSVMVTDENGMEVPLVCYVDAVNNRLQLIPANVAAVNGNIVVPEIPSGSLVVRMGRAAGELDVQTSQYNALPRKNFNYCQIFKTQVEQSTLQKIADKEVGWTFSDQEEVAIIDMRLCMEKNFLFGARYRAKSVEKNEDVWLTGGIWTQAGKDFVYDAETFDNSALIGLMREAFTKNAGSTRKILIGGSGLITTLNNLSFDRVVKASEKETVWGVDFHIMTSKFGTLYVVHSEVFDLCGRPDDGIIVDPEYITKYTHIPFSAERLSLKSSGVRNSEAVVMTEASCLVLRYPDAHMRVTKKSSSPAETVTE